MAMTAEEKKKRNVENNKKYRLKKGIKPRTKLSDEERKERKKISQKKYYDNNTEKVKNKNKKFRDNNPDYSKESTKKWRKANPEKAKINGAKSKRKYYINNKEKINKSVTKWRKANPEKTNAYNNKWRKNNPEKVRISVNKTVRKRLLNDNLFKLSNNIRTTIRDSFRKNGYSKKTKTFNILGCSFEDFSLHLEKQFESWMNWENKGNPKDGKFEPNKTWDIDHIIPLSSAKTEEELIKLNHYTNLRPLCSYYNRFVKRHHLEEDLKKDLVDNL